MLSWGASLSPEFPCISSGIGDHIDCGTALLEDGRIIAAINDECLVRRRRYLQLRLAERYLPAEVVRRPKQGFSSALPYMMARQFRRLFAHYLSEAHLVASGFLRRPAIQRLLDEHLSGRADHGNRLWLLLNGELWHRIHIGDVPVEDLHAEVEQLLGMRAGAEAERVLSVG